MLPQGLGSDSGRLATMGQFGSNPGALVARTYVPANLASGAPLVVVLHGCTQTPDGYDHGSGWSRLADELGFALLYPEQVRGNNPNLCFNWFSPTDAARGRGEALSIRQMVAAMHQAHGTDPKRTFVTGLSAGGAMTAAMLATYPEVFAGGAVIAGLPFGTAHNVPEALERMRGQGGPAAGDLSALARSASGHTGPWPTLSVWHGTSDATVNHGNAASLIDQWRGLHQVSASPSSEDRVDGYPHRVWTDPAGRPVIEEYRITGMAHGTPLSTSAPDSDEVAGAFMLEVGISSTRRIAAFWGIDQGADVRRSADADVAPAPAPKSAATQVVQLRPEPRPAPEPAPGASDPGPSGIGKTIEDALRAAGLMR